MPPAPQARDEHLGSRFLALRLPIRLASVAESSIATTRSHDGNYEQRLGHVAALLRSVEGPIVTVGHSYGGAVTSNAAAGPALGRLLGSPPSVKST
jgi:pimeloyl-ACP methyl ester carboxylesterase